MLATSLKGLKKTLRANPADAELRRIYADALEESGDTAAADVQHRAACQTTTEGTMIVTVGRHGANTARCGNGVTVPVWGTKIYHAVRRADGLLIWKLWHTVGRGTSGHNISQPMLEAARYVAEQRGLVFHPGVRQNAECE